MQWQKPGKRGCSTAGAHCRASTRSSRAASTARAACSFGADQAGDGRDIFFTRSDVNEIQLAKGAVRAGTKVLLAEAGITEEALDEVVMAGAFGTYLDIHGQRCRHRDAAGRTARPLPPARQRGWPGAVEMLVSRDQPSLA
jgi:hypothetical protein